MSEQILRSVLGSSHKPNEQESRSDIPWSTVGFNPRLFLARRSATWSAMFFA